MQALGQRLLSNQTIKQRLRTVIPRDKSSCTDVFHLADTVVVGVVTVAMMMMMLMMIVMMEVMVR